MLNKPPVDILSMVIYSTKGGHNPIFPRIILYNTIGILFQRRFSIHNVSCTYNMIISHTLASERTPQQLNLINHSTITRYRKDIRLIKFTSSIPFFILIEICR